MTLSEIAVTYIIHKFGQANKSSHCPFLLTYSSDPQDPQLWIALQTPVTKIQARHSNPSNAQGGGEDMDDACIQAYHNLLTTSLPNLAHDLGPTTSQPSS